MQLICAILKLCFCIFLTTLFFVFANFDLDLVLDFVPDTGFCLTRDIRIAESLERWVCDRETLGLNLGHDWPPL